MNINDFSKIYFLLKEKYGPYHPFTRNMLLIIKGEFGSDGFNACLRGESPTQEVQEVQEEKTPESDAPRRVKKQKQKKM